MKRILLSDLQDRYAGAIPAVDEQVDRVRLDRSLEVILRRRDALRLAVQGWVLDRDPDSAPEVFGWDDPAADAMTSPLYRATDEDVATALAWLADHIGDGSGFEGSP